MDEKLARELATNRTYLSGPSRLTFAPAASCTLAEIRQDGEVWIDWDAVDQLLAEPGSNPQMAIYARLMLACRDGTWKPITKAGERKE